MNPSPSAQTQNRDGLEPEPFWFKSGVIYELNVRAFYDSDGNGVGDFCGLTEKLDYLKDLGVTALWLLPFYPSPLKDDGYDIADYCDVHPIYGTLADFKSFLSEAHHRGLRVITELVLNHTSDQHPWFQRARRAKPGSPWRNFYVWSDSPAKYKDARIIFKDIEVSNWTWDHEAGAYYWHRFFSHQPDLNFENPDVQNEILKVVDFWLDLGVDGLRLDAVPYLFEREGTSCENLPETHAFLKRLRAHVDGKYTDRMLLAEANQWPEDAVAYFGNGKGDECHMAYHFPLMPRLFMAVRMEDRTPIVEILEQTPPIPETTQWALFLRNHDELTLEMVTDEERDYMYRMYAHVHQARLNLGIRRRLAPLLGNDRKRIELLNALLMSLPGTPVLYYGDEIGMGDNIYLGDRNGVRTPMQWSSDKNAGFSRANPQSVYLPIIYDPDFHYEAVNVEAQVQNLHSLLWSMRRLLALRKRWRALGEGRCEFLQPENRRILAYLLRFEEETLLVVANLSRFVQPLELDLSTLKGLVPMELFGRMEFPPITEHPYFLTLSPHAFLWFSLETKLPAEGLTGPATPVVLTVADGWQSVLAEKNRSALEKVLAVWIRKQRWFGGKANTVKNLTVRDVIPMPGTPEPFFFLFLQVDYVRGDSENYSLPLAFATGPDADQLQEHLARLVFAAVSVKANGQTGVLYDAVGSPAFCHGLLEMIVRDQRLKGIRGTMEGWQTPALKTVLGEEPPPPAAVGKAEQSNSSILFGDKLILKLFRRIESGRNPELEIGRVLTAQQFANVPPLGGALQYSAKDKTDVLDLAVAQGFIPNAKDAWTEALDTLGRFYDRVAGLSAHGESPPATQESLFQLVHREFPQDLSEIIGTYIESARLLGTRTAALHVALSSSEHPDFIPEPFTSHYQRGLLQSMRNLASRNLFLLRKEIKMLPDDVVPLARRVIELEPEIIRHYQSLFERRLVARRIRCHGDYHLGQVLWTGMDFIILDFEGEPAVSLSERRIKRSPLRDVAGMLRSFDYAASTALQLHIQRGSLPPDRRAEYEAWARAWLRWVSAAFLRAYLEGMRTTDLLPAGEDDLQVMLRAYLLNKAVYEILYELNNRPAWLHVPLRGVLELLEQHQ